MITPVVDTGSVKELGLAYNNSNHKGKFLALTGYGYTNMRQTASLDALICHVYSGYTYSMLGVLSLHHYGIRVPNF
jgi:hypothetical protein